MRVLCVAEKNDAAKAIATILSHGQFVRREGRSKFNKIYQFNRTIINDLPASVIFTSVSGHMMNFEFPLQYRNWTAVAPAQLFTAPVERKVMEQMRPIEQTLLDESRLADMLIIWTDCDREGENIGREVELLCRRVNRALEVHRARFSEITPHAIQHAVDHLARLDERVADAVDCRAELDLRIGAAFTRLQTLHLQRTFHQQLPNTEPISYGSCQFPTLGFVVERYKAIRDFVTEPFWRLVVRHRRDNIDVEFVWERVRLFERAAVQMLFDECRAHQSAIVTDVTGKPKSRWRPVAMDTVSFEKLAVRKLRLTAKDAMATAEALYTKGFISYPRTETNKFPAGLDLVPLVRDQTVDTQWGAFAATLLTNGIHPRNGSKSDGKQST
jgi:DNA topoisomerase-3